MKLFGVRLKNSAKRGLNCRDVIGAAVLASLLIFIFYDRNFFESLGGRKTFSKIDRIVMAKLVPDLSFIGKRDQEEWFGDISEILKAASGIFEREFGIRIIAGDLEIWRDTAKIADLKKLRRKIKSGPCDIIISFTKRDLDPDNPGFSGGVLENAVGVIGNVVILRSRSVEKRQLILAHEIAHLFWAQHTDKEGFLMSRDGESNKEKIDIFNWRIVIFNKYKNFHKYDFLF
ncbi:MAG: hypothetical protein AAB564_01015 [Patescibacteria group bacterium]